MELKLARQLAHLTQQALAERAEVDPATISKLERDPTRYLVAQYQTVVNIARVLGVAPDALFPVPPVRWRSAA